MPRKFKRALPNHEVYTIAEMGWKGKQNGVLLALVLEHSFHAIITADKNFQHQQNFTKYSVPLIVLDTLFITFDDLAPLAPKVEALLRSGPNPGPTVVSLT